MRCLWLPVRFWLTVLWLTLPMAAACIQYSEARSHIGEVGCVSGRVVRVQRSDRGIHYLTFCEDYRTCPFTVVVFPRDLKNVGDVRRLEGKLVEIHGPLKGYDGHAEIILSEARQVKGANIDLPPVPKDYDVERKGRFSIGTFRPSKSHARAKPCKARNSRSIDEEADAN
jgi:DNA/RNA endonuclease YhcR with UshA esterase domain